jgi:hypothetical protein
MSAPANITNAQSDRELILVWMADKSRTTQISFKSTIEKFIEFIDKPLSEVRLDDLTETKKEKILVIKRDVELVKVNEWTIVNTHLKVIMRA